VIYSIFDILVTSLASSIVATRYKLNR